MSKLMNFKKNCFLAAAIIGLSGCGIARQGTDVSHQDGSAIRISGLVHGGQQPVSGATIQLYAVGNTGRGSASTPLILQTVLTGSDGSFNITGPWSCTNTAQYGSDPLLYLVATGGNAGLGGAANNPALAMMAALGPCSTVTPQSFINVNEVTTVASVYALAPFMLDVRHVGAAAAAAGGLSNAFGTVNTLVNITTGASPGPGLVAGETVPVREIYSLANSLATCISSSGGAPCSALFGATTPSQGAAPVDTIGAALQIAHEPATNVALIFAMAGTTPPFLPSLTAAPLDWTMMLKFSGGGLSAPTGIALDAAGNAWLANSSGGSVTALSSQGARLTGAIGYSGSNNLFGAQAVAIDKAGNVWLADSLLSSVVKLTVSGGIVQNNVSYSSGINGPTCIAVDSQNHVWVANFAGGTITELSQTGTPMGAGPLTGGGILQSPAGIAIDRLGSVWVTDNSSSVVAKFDQNQTLLSGPGFTDHALVAPEGIALDAQGRAWVADNGNAGVSLFGANGAVVLATPISGGGLNSPVGVAIDGAGAAWVTNSLQAGTLTRAVGTGVTERFGSLATPAGVAIDASGNVWTANAGDDSVAKFVGLAAPVITPAAANVGP